MESMQQQQQEPQQEQEQQLASQGHCPYLQRPLSPITEEAVAELARIKKRSRESPITIYDSSDEDRGVKRRQTLDSRDGAEATVEETSEATSETSSDTDSCDVPSPGEANCEERSRIRMLEDEEASTRQASPQTESHGEADGREETNEDIRSDELHSENVPDWQALLGRGRREPSSPPDSEPDSECFALPRSMWPKEHKSDPFRDPSWHFAFQRFGTFVHGHPRGLGRQDEDLCRELLERDQSLPKNTLFDDEVLGETCARIQHRNETMIFRDVTPLIAPSAEILASRGETHLSILCESTNEVWTYAQPIIRLQPQPSYAVGFKAQAFTEEQFSKVTEFFDDRCTAETSPIMGTSYMFFPCFSCEIGPLAITQRQNVHNMTVGMHAVVELFRGVNREAELHRQILAFSISHNHRQVQIVAHYPVILGGITNYFQQILHSFDFADPGCSDRWAAYRFTRNIYDTWMPAHFDWICSAIDDLPLECMSDVDTEHD